MNITNYTWVIIIFWAVFSLVNLKYLSEIINKVEAKKNKSNNDVDVLEKSKVLLEDDAIKKINNILDEFIKDASIIYLMFVRGSNKEYYLNESEQTKLAEYIFLSVKRKMTVEIRMLLGIINVIESEKDLDDIIKLKIKIHILDLAVEINQPIDD